MKQWLHNRISNNLLWQVPGLGVLVGAVLVVFLGLGSIFPVLTIYAQARGISTAEIGFSTAAFMLANFLFLLPMGWLSDRVGRKPLMLFGLLLHTLTMLGYLGLGDATMLVALRFVEGIGACAMWPAARAYVMDNAPAERRGQALGLVGAAINAGIMLGPAIGGFLGAWTGFSGPIWFGAITGVLAGSAVLIFLTGTRPQAAPADEVATSPGDAQPSALRRINWAAILPVLFIAAGGGVANGLFSTLWNIWLHDLGADLNTIGLSYTLFGLPLLVVGPIAGKLADRHNRIPLILFPTIVAASVYFSYAFLTNVPLIIGLGLLEGAALAFLGPSIDSYFADIVPAHVRGRLQGVTGSVNTAVAFVASASVGVLYGLNSGLPFIAAAVATTSMTVLAAIFMLPHEAKLRPRRATGAATPAPSEPPVEAKLTTA